MRIHVKILMVASAHRPRETVATEESDGHQMTLYQHIWEIFSITFVRNKHHVGEYPAERTND